MNNDLIRKAEEYIRDLFKDNSDGHDADHSLRVLTNAMAIAENMEDIDLEAIALAALLHDVDDHKLFDTKDNANARSFLRDNGIEDGRTDFICSIINSVSFSKNRGKKPDSTEGKIVQDADRLDAIGAVGIARTFAYGGKNGRSLDDSIRHFHDKLLLLKDELNTEAARKMAEKRHKFMLEFMSQYKSEMGNGNGQ
jgi:uncharacterized protein